MESGEYKEGIDEPKELKGLLNSLGDSLQKSRATAMELSTQYQENGLVLDDKKFLEMLDELASLLMRIRSHKDMEYMFLPESRIMLAVDRLRDELLELITKATEALNKTMPTSFTATEIEKTDYLYLCQNPQAVIQSAFALFESRLRARINANADLFGEALINAAYGNNGQLKHGETLAEQLGTRNLLSGAYATFRNPRMHRVVEDNERSALAIITLVDLLIQVVEDSQPTS
jgi:hypothetical protein